MNTKLIYDGAKQLADLCKHAQEELKETKQALADAVTEWHMWEAYAKDVIKERNQWRECAFALRDKVLAIAQGCEHCNGSQQDHDGEGWLNAQCPKCAHLYQFPEPLCQQQQPSPPPPQSSQQWPSQCTWCGKKMDRPKHINGYGHAFCSMKCLENNDEVFGDAPTGSGQPATAPAAAAPDEATASRLAECERLLALQSRRMEYLLEHVSSCSVWIRSYNGRAASKIEWPPDLAQTESTCSSPRTEKPSSGGAGE